MSAPRVVWMPGRVRTEIHLAAQDTDGAICLLVDHPPAGWSLPAHLHHGCAETIHIIEGEFEMRIDGERSLLHAGETTHIPCDVGREGGIARGGIGWPCFALIASPSRRADGLP